MCTHSMYDDWLFRHHSKWFSLFIVFLVKLHTFCLMIIRSKKEKARFKFDISPIPFWADYNSEDLCKWFNLNPVDLMENHEQKKKDVPHRSMREKWKCWSHLVILRTDAQLNWLQNATNRLPTKSNFYTLNGLARWRPAANANFEPHHGLKLQKVRKVAHNGNVDVSL